MNPNDTSIRKDIQIFGRIIPKNNAKKNMNWPCIPKNIVDAINIS